MAALETSIVIVHTSTAQLGGAEISLFESLKSYSKRPHFIVPAHGPLTDAINNAGYTYQIIAWPKGLSSLTQRRWFSFPWVLPGLVPYLYKLYRATLPLQINNSQVKTVWSSGFKSHCACLILSPWFGSKLIFDIRDFLKPYFLRIVIARTALIFRCQVRVNSKAVGRDFPGAEIHYPIVQKLQNGPIKSKSSGVKIVMHLAYFAPYKGQDIFLNCARKILDAGINAEFWMSGDVIYPGPVYERYRESLFSQAAKLKLTEHVRFLGKIAPGESVHKLLGQAHLLLHCTREPEPFGRVVVEALQQGCEVIAHRGSGVCEVTKVNSNFPDWIEPLQNFLGSEYVSLSHFPETLIKA